MKDKKFKNILTGETITASKAYYEFCLECHKKSEPGNKIIHPCKLSKDELIELGINLLKEDDDWDEI